MFKKILKKFRDNGGSDDIEFQHAVKRMHEQLKSVNGSLTFSMTVDEDGWFSRCKEFPAIVTGGTSTNPSQDEIMKSTIEAIKTAFHVPITQLAEVNPEKLKVNSSPVKVTWERNFCLA